MNISAALALLAVMLVGCVTSDEPMARFPLDYGTLRGASFPHDGLHTPRDFTHALEPSLLPP